MRLGDLDRLAERMCDICNTYHSEEPCEPSDCIFYNSVAIAPTIDAVPVVRCRDCKYAYINSFSSASGVALCSHWTNKAAGAQIVVRQDDFCSYGQRKEAAHEVSK